MPLARYKDLCIDAVDPARLGRFWAAALHQDVELLDDGDARLTGADPGAHGVGQQGARAGHGEAARAHRHLGRERRRDRGSGRRRRRS